MQNKSTLKVLLINAPVIEVFEPWYDEPAFGRVGLAYLAGYLRTFADFPVEIKIIDAKFERLNFEDTLKQVIEFSPSVVGLTAFTNEIKPCGYLAHKIKERLPEALTVIGGAHVTAIPEQTLQEFPAFDVAAVGEGEITFLELCRNVFLQNSFHRITGLVFREGEKLVQTPLRERILDQNSIPLPAWDLLPPARTYFIQTVRGCPFNCVFCMNHNGKIARKRSVENVIQELEMLIERYKPEQISFGDELFSVDMKRTEELMDAMIEKKMGSRIKWDAQTHVRFVNYPLFVKMKQAGASRIDMGVETGDEESLKNMGKATNLPMIFKAFEDARKAGVSTGSLFLFGQPDETKETIRRTINLAVTINATLPMFGLMTPYPGTEVAKIAARGEGGYKLVSSNWDHYRKHFSGALAFKHFSRQEFEVFQIWAYLKVFLWNLRLKDLLRFIWEYRQAALGVLKNSMRKNDSEPVLSRKPRDYDTVLNAGAQFQYDQFITSTDDWRNYQKQEVIRANKIAHAKPS